MKKLITIVLLFSLTSIAQEKFGLINDLYELEIQKTALNQRQEVFFCQNENGDRYNFLHCTQWFLAKELHTNNADLAARNHFEKMMTIYNILYYEKAPENISLYRGAFTNENHAVLSEIIQKQKELLLSDDRYREIYERYKNRDYYPYLKKLNGELGECKKQYLETQNGTNEKKII